MDGQPRLVFIATLGAIAADAIEAQFFDEWVTFWRVVEPRLARLDNRLTPDERAAVVQALEAKVPRKTEEEATEQRRKIAVNCSFAGFRWQQRNLSARDMAPMQDSLEILAAGFRNASESC